MVHHNNHSRPSQAQHSKRVLAIDQRLAERSQVLTALANKTGLVPVLHRGRKIVPAKELLALPLSTVLRHIQFVHDSGRDKTQAKPNMSSNDSLIRAAISRENGCGR